MLLLVSTQQSQSDINTRNDAGDVYGCSCYSLQYGLSNTTGCHGNFTGSEQSVKLLSRSQPNVPEVQAGQANTLVILVIWRTGQTSSLGLNLEQEQAKRDRVQLRFHRCLATNWDIAAHETQACKRIHFCFVALFILSISGCEPRGG